MAFPGLSAVARKKPLARWLALAGYGNERSNGERLFGQDQLVFTGDAQQVTLPGVFDLDSRGPAEDLFAGDPGAGFGLVGKREALGIGLLRVHGQYLLQTRIARIFVEMRMVVKCRCESFAIILMNIYK